MPGNRVNVNHELTNSLVAITAEEIIASTSYGASLGVVGRIVSLLQLSCRDPHVLISTEYASVSNIMQRIPFTDGVPLAFQAMFNGEQFARLKAGLIPRGMDDKWFIYYEEPHLFLHRSWTGQPVYRLTLKNVPNGAEVTEALLSKDPTDASGCGSDYQVRLLDFLVSNLLLGEAKPFPVPSGVTEPMHGVFQHHISGTGHPQSRTELKKPWWRIW